jgi:hypothetical protein
VAPVAPLQTLTRNGELNVLVKSHPPVLHAVLVVALSVPPVELSFFVAPEATGAIVASATADRRMTMRFIAPPLTRRCLPYQARSPTKPLRAMKQILDYSPGREYGLARPLSVHM